VDVILDWGDLTTYALGLAAGWWLAGHWGAGVAALLFCAARVYAATRGRS
jgi:hypothetical protein